jgi:hypothetical protein
MADVTELTLLDELIASLLPRVAPGDVTVSMLRKQTKKSYDTCREILDGWVDDGKLETYEAQTDGGKIVTAYRRKR